MRAFVLPRAGADTPEFAEVEIPPMADDEILVRVKAVGVGVNDPFLLPDDAVYPYPIGIEAAGIVADAGRLVSGRRHGDRVAVVSRRQPKGGTWAAFVAVRATSLIVPIPAEMSFVKAAAVPIAGDAALRALTALGPATGSLFVAGGSGAIGTLAIQLAVRRGWRVAASASAANHDHLLALGAELAVDYRDEGWPQQVREWAPYGVDAAMAVQPGTSKAGLQVVRDGGRLVTVSDDELSPERGVHVQDVSHDIDVRDELLALMPAVAAGEIRIEIEHVHPFDDAAAALTAVTTRHARGKRVLRLE